MVISKLIVSCSLDVATESSLKQKKTSQREEFCPGHLYARNTIPQAAHCPLSIYYMPKLQTLTATQAWDVWSQGKNLCEIYLSLHVTVLHKENRLKKKTYFDRKKEENGPKSSEKYWNIKIGAFHCFSKNFQFAIHIFQSKTWLENTEVLSL